MIYRLTYPKEVLGSLQNLELFGIAETRQLDIFGIFFSGL